MNFKFVIAIFATLFTILGYIPYFKDIFARKTTPHLYTWLIWTITQGTAAAALLYGGGKFGSFSLILGSILAFSIFLISLKYGTEDVTLKDKIILIFALLAIVVWWQLDNPLVAVLMVSIIDGVGYIPTIRKSFKDPRSETISFWVIMAIVALLALISSAEYNFLTVTYLAVLFAGDMAVISVCLFRRRVVKIKK